MNLSRYKELLELVEEYTCGPQSRYRFRVKNTNIVINISANSMEEAWNRVIALFNELGINDVVEELKKRYKESLQMYRNTLRDKKQ